MKNMDCQNKKTEHLRIAMFGHKRIPSREGGIEIVVEELAARMVQNGHQVTCYNRSGHHVSGNEFDTKIGWKDIIWLNQKTPHKYSVLTA